MTMYMTQFSYTAEAWAALAKHPEDRSVKISKLIEALGGRLDSIYYTFGEFDGLVIFEGADDETTLAAVIAVHTAGYIKATKTTKLLTMQEAMDAMRKAGSLMYKAPQS